MKSFYKIITLSIFSLVIALGVFTSCNKSSKKQLVKDERQKKILVYAYDSFTSDWGPGPALKKLLKSRAIMNSSLFQWEMRGSFEQGAFRKNLPVPMYLLV